MKIIEKMRNKRLCGIVFKELEKKGLCVWKVDSYKVGVTLSNDIKKNYDTLEKSVIELQKSYKANICMTLPVFAAGGVYASYLSVSYK